MKKNSVMKLIHKPNDRFNFRIDIRKKLNNNSAEDILIAHSIHHQLVWNFFLQ